MNARGGSRGTRILAWTTLGTNGSAIVGAVAYPLVGELAGIDALMSILLVGAWGASLASLFHATGVRMLWNLPASTKNPAPQDQGVVWLALTPAWKFFFRAAAGTPFLVLLGVLLLGAQVGPSWLGPVLMTGGTVTFLAAGMGVAGETIKSTTAREPRAHPSRPPRVKTWATVAAIGIIFGAVTLFFTYLGAPAIKLATLEAFPAPNAALLPGCYLFAGAYLASVGTRIREAGTARGNGPPQETIPVEVPKPATKTAPKPPRVPNPPAPTRPRAKHADHQAAARAPKIALTVAIAGVIVAGLAFVPFLSTPWMITRAEGEFAREFGDQWRANLPASETAGFRPNPVSLAGAYLGVPVPAVPVTRDVEYYANTSEGITLRFDVYTPPPGAPTHHAAVINLHGGSWQFGDKGTTNIASFSQQLAARGYVVFDIQYALVALPGVTGALPAPVGQRNDTFTVLDCLRTIGYFTHRLADEYAATYGADVDHVFFMGRSAGGHLAQVAGLGYNALPYAGWFSPALTIRGVLSIYGPDDARYYFHEVYPGLLPGTPDETPLVYALVTPSALVDPADPAVLAYHGTTDGLVPLADPRRVQAACQSAGVPHCLVACPLAGHGSDLFASAPYAQAWLYYAERFMALVR